MQHAAAACAAFERFEARAEEEVWGPSDRDGGRA